MISRLAILPGRGFVALPRNQITASSPVTQFIRQKATGDNSELYIPAKTDFTRDTLPAHLITPPRLPEVKRVLINKAEEVKQHDERIDDVFCTWFGQNMPTVDDDKDPARDVVNFPRPRPVIHPEGRRLVILPDSWFRAMYPITGVTGPYVLIASTTVAMLSKEWLIIEGEMLTGIYLGIVFWAINNKFGAAVGEYINKCREGANRLWYDWRNDSIELLKSYKEQLKETQEQVKAQSILFEAKRENVQLQREAEYRRRLHLVYSEVKRKLDYQLARDTAKKQFEQQHMVNWILRSVEDAVDKQDEKTVLSKCIADLKNLSVARKGAI